MAINLATDKISTRCRLPTWLLGSTVSILMSQFRLLADSRFFCAVYEIIGDEFEVDFELGFRI